MWRCVVCRKLYVFFFKKKKGLNSSSRVIPRYYVTHPQRHMSASTLTVLATDKECRYIRSFTTYRNVREIIKAARIIRAHRTV